MLLKWFTHEFCSSRLESRSRAVRSRIIAFEAERKEVDERIHQESEQLQHKLEDLVAQHQAELQETVAFLNRHLSLCQDMVQALQKYTEQAYATVDVWLQSRVQWGTYNSTNQRIRLLKEYMAFLQEAEKAYRVLIDRPKRQEWCAAQPESAFTANSHVQDCTDALKRRRKAIVERNRTNGATLRRIVSQQGKVRTELRKAHSDKKNVRIQAEACSSKHQEQRDVMNEALHHAIELHKKLKTQSIGSLKKQREQLRIELEKARKEQALAKEAVNRADEERNFYNLVRQRGDIAFEKWVACRRQIEEIESQLQPHWDKLDPYKYTKSIETHLDGFLQDPRRRRQAIGSLASRGPSNPHRNYSHHHGDAIKEDGQRGIPVQSRSPIEEVKSSLKEYHRSISQVLQRLLSRL